VAGAKGAAVVTTARVRILGRLARARLKGAGGASVAHAAERVPLAATPEHAIAAPSPGERFETELAALGGTIHQAADGVAAARIVGEICRAQECSRVLAWSAEAIDVDGYPEGLAAAGLTVVDGDLPEGNRRQEALGALDPIRVGVTGADGAIAESGSIVLLSGPGRPRLASLLPPVHVAIVRADRIHPDLPALVAAVGERLGGGSNLVIITGPSRTADIEMTLTRGVHGPGEVHVILVGSNSECGRRNAE
jgi:L-lactate dehydrogenase complex protein LldG